MEAHGDGGGEAGLIPQFPLQYSRHQEGYGAFIPSSTSALFFW